MVSPWFVLVLPQTRHFHLELERFSLNNWYNSQLMFLTPFQPLHKAVSSPSLLSPLWFLLPFDPLWHQLRVHLFLHGYLALCLPGDPSRAQCCASHWEGQHGVGALLEQLLLALFWRGRRSL